MKELSILISGIALGAALMNFNQAEAEAPIIARQEVREIARAAYDMGEED